MDVSVLKQLGLTTTQALVFHALLEHGTNPAGPLIQATELQNAVVHRALQKLIAKGLVTYTLEGKTKHYQPISAQRLLQKLQEQQEELKHTLNELEQKRTQQETQATTYRGLKGIRELWNTMISEEGTTLQSYGAPGKAHDLLSDHFWKQHHVKRLERNITSEHIFS